MVSPGLAGLSLVIGAPVWFAQQSALFVAVSKRSGPVLVELAEGPAATLAVMAIPSPTGPGCFARRRIRVKAAAAEATTRSSGLALTRAIKASRMLARVSVDCTVYV